MGVTLNDNITRDASFGDGRFYTAWCKHLYISCDFPYHEWTAYPCTKYKSNRTRNLWGNKYGHNHSYFMRLSTRDFIGKNNTVTCYEHNAVSYRRPLVVHQLVCANKRSMLLRGIQLWPLDFLHKRPSNAERVSMSLRHDDLIKALLSFFCEMYVTVVGVPTSVVPRRYPCHVLNSNVLSYPSLSNRYKPPVAGHELVYHPVAPSGHVIPSISTGYYSYLWSVNKLELYNKIIW